jgi:hypothetical protein
LASTTWSRICDHIDMENSQSNTVARPGVDPTRYREGLAEAEDARRQGTGRCMILNHLGAIRDWKGLDWIK